MSVVRAYVEMTKPRIIELLLVTTIPAMVVAADGWPGLGLILVTLLGGTLAAGGQGTGMATVSDLSELSPSPMNLSELEPMFWSLEKAIAQRS